MYNVGTKVVIQIVHQNLVMIKYLQQMTLTVKTISQDVSICQMETVTNNLEHALVM